MWRVKGIVLANEEVLPFELYMASSVDAFPTFVG